MSYLAVKHLHITCAALSGMLFLLRGIWMMRASALLQQRWVRIVPHVIERGGQAIARSQSVTSQPGRLSPIRNT